MIPTVFSIAGSDPGGGAGLQADLKTFAAFEVFGCGAVTAITAQNARTVSMVEPLTADAVVRQLDAVFDDVDPDVVKIGMLGNATVARAVAGALRAHRARHVVIDPVLRASTGASLLDRDGLDVLRRELIPLATVVTPNAPEAAALLGGTAPASLPGMRDAARALAALGSRWVLVTGGHVDTGSDCVDVLTDGTDVHELRTDRLDGPPRHGTGCTLSSAIAALLALGFGVPDACAEAQRYVAATILAGTRSKAGRGTAALNHIPYSRVRQNAGAGTSNGRTESE